LQNVKHMRTLLVKWRWRWLAAACVAWACVPLLLAGEGRDDRLGLPAVSVALEKHSAAKAALGRALFFDKRLSGDGSISCAGCHQPERAFSDGKVLAQGIGGRTGTRNTPTLLNAVFNTSQFWDGRRDSLEAQAPDPFVNAREHGLADPGALLDLLRRDPAYVKAFFDAFQVAADAIRTEHVGRAIAAFECTLVAGGSAFDRYYFSREEGALSAGAKRGLDLFRGRAMCAGCHTIGEGHALFTDNLFHGLSVGLPRIAPRLPELTSRLVRARAGAGNVGEAVLSDEDVAELGRFAVTLQPGDIGKFRTPSVRNVALTAPYMHDGSVATLAEAVELEIYYRSAASGVPLILTPLEKGDLLEFLHSLTSPAAARFAPEASIIRRRAAVDASRVTPLRANPTYGNLY
jgi:cytochrome c peroxidase